MRHTDLRLDGHGVDLAHVAAAVIAAHSAQRHRPRVDVVSDHREPRVIRDDVLVDREDALVLRFDPRHLATLLVLGLL